MGGQSFLQAIHYFYLIQMPIQFYEDISNDYRVEGCAKMKITKFSKNHLRAITLEQKKWKAIIIVRDTLS